MKKHATLKNWNTAINLSAFAGGGIGVAYGIGVYITDKNPNTPECVGTPLVCGAYGICIGACVGLLPVLAPIGGIAYGARKLIHFEMLTRNQ